MGVPPIHRKHVGGNAESYNDLLPIRLQKHLILNDDITCDILDLGFSARTGKDVCKSLSMEREKQHLSRTTTQTYCRP